MSDKKIVQARVTFVTGIGVVKQGTVVYADDPVVKGREDLFEDLNDVVERATAAPGEKRPAPAGKPAQKAARKKQKAAPKTKTPDAQ